MKGLAKQQRLLDKSESWELDLYLTGGSVNGWYEPLTETMDNCVLFPEWENNYHGDHNYPAMPCQKTLSDVPNIRMEILNILQRHSKGLLSDVLKALEKPQKTSDPLLLNYERLTILVIFFAFPVPTKQKKECQHGQGVVMQLASQRTWSGELFFVFLAAFFFGCRK